MGRAGEAVERGLFGLAGPLAPASGAGRVFVGQIVGGVAQIGAGHARRDHRLSQIAAPRRATRDDALVPVHVERF
ncbi:hypothetical protein IX55_11815 [Paracoccus sanguinis]|nr:hypothetical protein IX55_11815 [Paracoccus sanguinis]